MRINGNTLELIKQLNENARTSMDEETFQRLVSIASEEIHKQLPANASDEDKMEVVLSLIEDVPGFEETQDAVALGKRVLAAVR